MEELHLNEVLRPPYVEKFICDIKKEDVNVAVSGMVISKEDNSFILDDNTGQIIVNLINSQEVEGYIRVLGRVLPYEEGIQLQGFIVQDFNKIDKVLYKKVKELLR